MLDREQSFENLECQVAYIHLIMILDQIAGVEYASILYHNYITITDQ